MDKSESADRDSANHRHIRAKRCSLPDMRWQELLPPLLDRRARVAIVRKNCVGPNEYVILGAYAVPHRNAVFHGDVVAEPGAALDERVVPNVAPFADLGPVHHVRERPYP